MLALNSFRSPKRASCTASQHCLLAPTPEQSAYFSRVESFTKATDTSLTEQMIILKLPRLWPEVLLARGTHDHTQLGPETTASGTHSAEHKDRWAQVMNTKLRDPGSCTSFTSPKLEALHPR